MLDFVALYGFLSSCNKQGSSLVCGLCIAEASHCRTQALDEWTSVVAAHVGSRATGSVIGYMGSVTPQHGIFRTKD